MTRRAVIAAYLRSPFTPARKGELASTRPDELLGQVVRGLVAKTGIDPADIEDLICGCAFPEGEQGLNIGRIAVFLAGLPQSVAATTTNRYCGSSMQAVHQAAGAIALGSGEVFICAGVESMSRVPMWGFNVLPHPGLTRDYPEAFVSMGLTAENVARDWKITRQAQEEFALRSHQRAAKAQAAGLLDAEIQPITAVAGKGSIIVSRDGCIRGETTLEGLAGLKTPFLNDGSVTAGSSSPLTDGATALLVCSEDYAIRNNLTPLALIRSTAVAGCAPEIMGIGPVPASRKALHRAGISARDLSVVELNEAFAAQSLACVQDLEIDPVIVNPHGGAIALGHPLGATGARLVGKAASLLQSQKGRYALASQCIGGGQGIATVLEAL